MPKSCLFGHGKMSLYEKLSKSTVARSLISKCGESLPLSDVLNNLKSFVICYIYGDKQSSYLNLACATKWKRQKKKPLMRLLPDDDSLEQHIKRANFLAYIQCHPDLRRYPSPIGHGWELVNGCCRPVRHTKPALPILLQVLSTHRIAMTLTQSLNLNPSLILILNLNQQMILSHWMNLNYYLLQ